ncbi:SDR family NAD(P)-dependent oxidoreductase [Rhabdothermincola sediminis]|uniref:SDR family NAD(P)-dependent oxidoreductase n=1 Tax=Rhabdothermincola sediminis TaxID=2751370 RepID=UPI001AA039EE|nr:SDR family oxidoreductase [Rhabdothermincola sediminis]
MFDLSGRVALITGAGQNLGAEIARVLANNGAAVVVNDLFPDRAGAVASAISAAGGMAIAIEADVTDLEAVGQMVSEAEARLGPVDILVNNAGVPPNPSWDLLPFHQTSPESWRAWIDINLYGVLHCCHATVGGMVERGWGRVVNIVSDAGRTGEGLLAVYCAAKAGAAGFSRALAKEVAPHGVTVNALALGTLGPPGGDPELVQRMARRYPVGRIGAPADIAPAVLWLASDEASWVTGQTIPINGGYATS